MAKRVQCVIGGNSVLIIGSDSDMTIGECMVIGIIDMIDRRGKR